MISYVELYLFSVNNHTLCSQCSNQMVSLVSIMVYASFVYLFNVLYTISRIDHQRAIKKKKITSLLF